MADHDNALAEMAIEKLAELRQERDSWKAQSNMWKAETIRLRDILDKGCKSECNCPDCWKKDTADK